jgi:hypothetical protein
MNDTFTPESINPTTPAEPVGIAPVNAFVAALAEQVFQRVTKGLADNVNVLINEALAKREPETETVHLDLGVQAYVREQIEAAFENYDPAEHIDLDSALEDAIDEIDFADKIDTDDIVRSVLDNGDFEEKIKETVQGMTFDVSVS